MKPLIIIIKTLLICYLWSIVFIDGIRVVLLINWHFDIFMQEHWHLLKYKWGSGIPITKSEVGFFIILFSSIPLWFVGWIGLALVKWERLVKYIVYGPLYLYRKLTLKRKTPVVIKKKSIREAVPVEKKTPVVRKVPRKKAPLPSVALMQSNLNPNVKNTAISSRPASSFGQPPKEEAPLNHALFNFDDDDFDLDFDFDKDKKEESLKVENSIPSALVADEKPKNEENNTPNQQRTSKQQNNKKNNNSNTKKTNEGMPSTNKESHTPVLDVLNQKGYDVISAAIIKNTKIDYIGVSKKQLILCLVDKEQGDWLADEEKFNDEEPLWFSESSHRISPIRKLDIARDVLNTKLAVGDLNFELVSFLIIQTGNIINAEDMFDVWKGMNMNVARINRGSPKEINLFSKTLENCEEKTDKNTLEKLKKLIRSMA